MRCLACRRPLTNPASIKHGLGPDCLRKVVKAGTAPLEALEEFTVANCANKRAKRSKPAEPVADTRTPDLFDQLRAAALDDLHKALAVCLSCGINVTYTIE